MFEDFANIQRYPSPELFISGSSGNLGPLIMVYKQTSGFTLSVGTSEQEVTGTGVGSNVIPANSLKAGDTFFIELWGTCSSAVRESMTFRIRLGDLLSGAIAYQASSLPLPNSTNTFWMRLQMTCTAVNYTIGIASFSISQGLSNVFSTIYIGCDSGIDPGNQNPLSDLPITATIQLAEGDGSDQVQVNVYTIFKL